MALASIRCGFMCAYFCNDRFEPHFVRGGGGPPLGGAVGPWSGVVALDCAPRADLRLRFTCAHTDISAPSTICPACAYARASVWACQD